MPANGERRSDADAASTSGEFARNATTLVGRRLPHLLHLRPAARVLLLAGRQRPLFGPERRRRTDACGQHRRPIGAYCLSPDGKRVAFVGIARRQPGALVQRSPISGSPISRRGTPRNLTASYDFDINGGIGGDQRAPRGAMPGGPIWSRDGTHDSHRRRRTGQRQPEARRRRQRESRRPDQRQPGNHVGTPRTPPRRNSPSSARRQPSSAIST